MDGKQLMELLRSPHVTISVDGSDAGNLVATRLRLAMVPVSRRPSPPAEVPAASVLAGDHRMLDYPARVM